MSENGEKLTIAEFASRAGCTPQRVSQLLRKSLKEFQIVENGRKYILSDGLKVVLDAREKQGYRKGNETVSETVSNAFETVSSSKKIAELTAELEKVKQLNFDQTITIDRLTGECEQMREITAQAREKAAAADEARKRADAAEHQCAVKDEQIEALTAALQSAQQQAAELTTALAASQALQAGQIRLAMQNSDDGEKPVDEHEPPTKRGWLQKIFKRKKS